MAEKKTYYNEDANARYKKENYTRVTIRVHNKYETDVLDKLKSVDNKQRYIINLIRKDIKSSDK